MPSRRRLLSGVLLAGLGAGSLGVGVTYWRRLQAFVAARQQPTAWSDTPAPSNVVLTLDAPATPGRRINPLIYGVSVGSPPQLRATGARLNRWGGNPNSRYNWVNGSAWNAARDWEFRNYGADSDAPLTASSIADRFVAQTHAAGAAAWITLPALGWVARDGNTAHLSTGVPGIGGPPVDAAGDAIAGYDPSANRRSTSVPAGPRKPGLFVDAPGPTAEPAYQDEWVNHLVSRFGSAAAGGVAFYAIDNEPDLWASTHTDVHPVEPSYADLLALFRAYASAVKDVDPTARVTGPSISGWTALFYSARDRGTDNFRTHADRRAHADTPFLAWWLDQLREDERRTGRRLLDAIDVHYYPQAPGVFGPVGDEATQRRRLRSTRSLWDPTYVDESWIGEAVRLLPRLREWRDQWYPGTAIAIGEWNWGADDTLNGALALANVLGIFGREGIDMATYWTSPAPGTPGAHAFALYTDYDGAGHGFGDQTVGVSSSAPDAVQAYASRDTTTGELLVIVLNHRPDTPLPVSLPLPTPAADVQWYGYDASDASQIRDLGHLSDGESELNLTLPPESLSLLRITPRKP